MLKRVHRVLLTPLVSTRGRSPSRLRARVGEDIHLEESQLPTRQPARYRYLRLRVSLASQSLARASHFYALVSARRNPHRGSHGSRVGASSITVRTTILRRRICNPRGRSVRVRAGLFVKIVCSDTSVSFEVGTRSRRDRWTNVTRQFCALVSSARYSGCYLLFLTSCERVRTFP